MTMLETGGAADLEERMDVGVTVCEKLRSIMKERHVTQKKLSELSGVSKTAMNRICNYQPGMAPSLDSVYRIACALSVTVSDLTGESKLGDGCPRWLVKSWEGIKEDPSACAALRIVMESLAQTSEGEAEE